MIVAVTGTGTGVGKTVVSAALCSVAVRSGRSVAYLKAAQTGVPGDEPDVTAVTRLAGPSVTVREVARYPDPMSPEAAARASGLPPVLLADVVSAARSLDASHDVVVVEGAGGLLVRYAGDGWGITAVASELGAPLVVVAGTALGTLNALALTLEAAAHRGLPVAGVVVGSWPAVPTALDLSNEVDMTVLAGRALAAKLPAGAGVLATGEFAEVIAPSGPALLALLSRRPGSAAS